MKENIDARERLARYRRAAAELEELAAFAADDATWVALMEMASTRMRLAEDIARELDGECSGGKAIPPHTH